MHKDRLGPLVESPVLIAIKRFCIDSLEALLWNLIRFLFTVITVSRAVIFRVFRVYVSDQFICNLVC